MYQEQKEALISQTGFIKLVEEHECIYNHTSKPQEKAAAWQEIAEAIGKSVHECKEKWHRLRTAFTRSLRTSLTSQNKPYYLHDQLSFLIPYCKYNRETEGGSDNDEESPKILKVEALNTFHESDDDVYEDDCDVHIEEESPRIDRKRRSNEGEASARKMFLLSLMPDVAAMTDTEMRAFRMAVVNCLDGIINAKRK
ncbi:alcohol dehydrogenase transcription factor myb/SANT-like domain-containing protein [Phthorimaea operculella]|nr:alcohol dehydrogenase transcription factor myb/SANT-like domain-containing protein [Phthorimaea operculella]